MVRNSLLFFILILLLFTSCRKYPKNDSNYLETLTYADGSTYQRKWIMSGENDKHSSAMHISKPEEEINDLSRFYYMVFIYSNKVGSREMWAFCYDNFEGMMNNKFTKKRSYYYDGESFTKKGKLNFKGTFDETVIYFDTAGVAPNDTVKRSGTFLFEYTGKLEN